MSTKMYKPITLCHLGQSDQLSFFLLPKYAPVFKLVKLIKRTIIIWSEGAAPVEMECLCLTSCLTLSDQHWLILYANSVLDHVNKCVESDTTQKVIITYPNQKPEWSKKKLSGLKLTPQPGSICAAESRRIEERFNSSDLWRMWQEVQSGAIRKLLRVL